MFQMNRWMPLAFIAVLGLTFAPAMAKQHKNKEKEKEKGNKCEKVEVDLFERMDGDPADEAGSGEWAGFAKLKVEPCEAALETEVELKDGEPNTVYDVYIKVDGTNLLFADALMTDMEGEGEWEMYVDITDWLMDMPETLAVQIVVKPAGTTDIIGSASDTVEVPVCPCKNDDDECESEEAETDLNTRIGDELADEAGQGDTVGEVEIEPKECDASLEVKVEAEMLDPDTLYDVYVKVNGQNLLFEGALMTDEDGEGKWEMEVDVSAWVQDPLAVTMLDVQVVVKPADTTAIIGYATATETITLCPCEEVIEE